MILVWKNSKYFNPIFFQAYPEYLISYQIVRPDAVVEEGGDAAKASGWKNVSTNQQNITFPHPIMRSVLTLLSVHIYKLFLLVF